MTTLIPRLAISTISVVIVSITMIIITIKMLQKSGLSKEETWGFTKIRNPKYGPEIVGFSSDKDPDKLPLTSESPIWSRALRESLRPRG